MGENGMVTAVMHLAWDVLRPSSLLVIILLLGLCLAYAGRKTGRLLLLFSGPVLALIWLFPIGEWSLSTLERQYAPPTVYPEHVDGIIVLGGAVRPRLTSQWGLPSLNDLAERMTAFAGLAHRYPDARLVFTGGIQDGDSQLREADVARLLFSDLGVDTERVLFEDRAQTTWDNAVLSKALAQPKPGEVWLLVTSAFHMPRAEACFRRAGWEVVPWAVGYKSGALVWRPAGLNMPEELHWLDYAAHEWLGMAAYWAMGRMS